MPILKCRSWNRPCSPKPSLQITPEETTKLTPKRKRSNPSRSRSQSPPPQPWSWNWSWEWEWEWDWESTPSLLVSSSSPLLIPSPSLSPLSIHPRAESIPSFKPKAWLSVAEAILHNLKADTGTGSDPINRALLKSLEDAVWIVNEEITGIETVGEEVRTWGGVSVREAVEIVEEAESNIWACLDRVRAEIGEIYGDERDNKAKEAIQCLLMGNIGEVDALLECMNN